MKSAIASLLMALSAVPVTGDTDKVTMPEWMAGSWERIDDDKWADEYWTLPRAGIMLGSSRSGRGEQLGFWEHMRIAREADGKLAFWAIAGDQKPIRFSAKAMKVNEIVFENPAHDYPQRIRYWRDGIWLKAEISLIDGSKALSFQFTPTGAATAAK